MKKDEYGHIAFNSTIEHRIVERIRKQLKNSSIENITTQYHDNFVYIMMGYYKNECIKIHILIRNVESDNVAMNRDSFISDRKYNVNSLLVLGDRRHLYPTKFLFFNNINEIVYKNYPAPHILIPEREFEDIECLKD